MPDTWPERLQWAAWGLLAALLPVTSLPLLKPITRSGMVAPASVALLLPVVALWLAPALLRGARLNRAALPLLAFVSAALFSAGLAVFGGPPAWRSFNPLNSSLSALLTLGIGVSFFIATAAWARDDRRLRFLLRVINWSGLAIILWALAQAAFWRLTHTYPGWMEALQSFLSTSGLFPGRVLAVWLHRPAGRIDPYRAGSGRGARRRARRFFRRGDGLRPF